MFAQSWKRQIEGKDMNYVSPLIGDSIWTGRITKADRDGSIRDASRINRQPHDLCGNRLKGRTREQEARAMIQRECIRDLEFRRGWDALTPAQSNKMIAELAAKLHCRM